MRHSDRVGGVVDFCATRAPSIDIERRIESNRRLSRPETERRFGNPGAIGLGYDAQPAGTES